MEIRMFDVGRSKKILKKILLNIILPLIIIGMGTFFIKIIFETNGPLEQKIGISIVIILGAIFLYLKDFNKTFNQFLKREKVNLILKISELAILLSGIGFSIFLILDYLKTHSLSSLIGGIIFGLISMTLFIEGLKKF